MSSLHAEDAATAVVAALDAPSGTTTSWTTSRSPAATRSTRSRRAFGLGRLRTNPAWAIRAARRRRRRTRSSRRSGCRTRSSARRRDGHRQYPSLREGWRAEARATGGQPCMTHAIWCCASAWWCSRSRRSSSGSGPRSCPAAFYDDFPGLGRMWVAPDGPYNQHLVRDVGELNLALVDHHRGRRGDVDADPRPRGAGGLDRLLGPAPRVPPAEHVAVRHRRPGLDRRQPRHRPDHRGRPAVRQLGESAMRSRSSTSRRLRCRPRSEDRWSAVDNGSPAFALQRSSRAGSAPVSRSPALALFRSEI